MLSREEIENILYILEEVEWEYGYDSSGCREFYACPICDRKIDNYKEVKLEHKDDCSLKEAIDVLNRELEE